jgi:hypothetical protein
MSNAQTFSKQGRDIQVGDDLWFLNKPHRITSLRPIPESPLVQDGTLPADTFVAESHQPDGHVWGMTIDPTQRYTVR